MTFVNTAAIATEKIPAFFLPRSWYHAIVVVFTNLVQLQILAQEYWGSGVLEFGDGPLLASLGPSETVKFCNKER